MTDLPTMLRWYASDVENVTLYCDECGCEMVSVDGRTRKVLCPACREHRMNHRSRQHARESGWVKFDFSDDPVVAIVFAVIRQAIRDKTGRWHAPNPNYLDEPAALDLAECDPCAFLEDGAELWLKALGIGVRESMRRELREAEL
jgi:hypothetical protein